jgi:hypothetical protein
MGERITYILWKLVLFKWAQWVDQDYLRDSGKASGRGIGKFIANMWFN